jgi:ectoine hydroxylase-related dioxygenase (phytanoyl-CoA dioxygenase family)
MVKLNNFAVQPPVDILENNFTIRIHLDDTDEGNGALKVLDDSHDKVYRIENIDWQIKNEMICKVQSGGIMIMRPLLMHSSARSTSNNKRRVVHIEFSNIDLPRPIDWAEKEPI